MLPRTSLIRIQRHLYQRTAAANRGLLGELSPKLRHYYQEYQKDFRRYQALATPRELLLATLRSHVVLVGDYHTLAQAQRTVLRLLRQGVGILNRKKRKLVLALEMLRPEDNAVVADYLANRVSEKSFLKKIDFHQTWGFHWPHYRALFEFARHHSAEIVGINLKHRKSIPQLEARDKFAASVLSDLTQKNPDALIFVLVGDLHLATAHLPRLLSAELKQRKLSRKTLVVHQNNDRFYWSLVESGLEHLVEVVKVRKDVYCVLNTPPWVKLQSHVKWTESMSSSEFDPQEKKEALLFSDLDLAEDVFELVTLLKDFFQISGRSISSKFQDFEVHGPFSAPLFELLKRRKLYRDSELKFAQSILSREGYFFFPKGNHHVLSNLNLNHCAVLSTKYLHRKLSGYEGFSATPRKHFYSLVWGEALGYLGSKVINPKRKCNGPIDLVRGLRKKHFEGMKQKVARFTLRHLDKEQKEEKLPSRLELSQIEAWFTAKTLGEILGEALYAALFEGRIHKEEIRTLFYEKFANEKKARSLYLTWAKRLDTFQLRHFSKRDRL